MNPQHAKLIAGVVLAVVVVGGLGTLATHNKRTSNDQKSTADDQDDAARGKSRSRSFNASSNGDQTAKGDSATSGPNKTAKANDHVTSVSALADGLTTNALGETEAETRDRERYETAQRNAFKYRKLDPNLIKPTELAPAFDNASKKYKVPKEILAALAYVESGGAHRDGANSMEAGFGVMNLRENNIVDTAAEAASLIGKPKEDVFYDQNSNIEAAAALLDRYYEDALATGVSESEAWYMAVSTYSGRPNPELAAAEADEVAGFMIKGFEANLTDGGGTFGLPPNSNPIFLPKNWKLVGLMPPATPGAMPQPINSDGSRPPQ